MYEYSIKRESVIKKIAERENTLGFTEINGLTPFVAKTRIKKSAEENYES